MLKVIIVAGARPNFMKVAPLVEAMKRRHTIFQPFLVHTGQHYDVTMSDAFFRDLEIPQPDVHLGAVLEFGAARKVFERLLLAILDDLEVFGVEIGEVLAFLVDHGDAERSQGRRRCQGRSGAVPHRQGRYPALLDRQGVVRCRRAQGKLPVVDRRGE